MRRALKSFSTVVLAVVAGLSGPGARVVAPAAAVVAAVAVSSPAQAYEKRIGTLTSTGTSVNQGTTASTFTIPAQAATLAIQCDAAACVTVGSGSGTTASCAVGSNKVQLSAQQLYDIPMSSVGTNAVDTVAVISVSGTVNCDVYQVITGP